ncbi:hypothetical protein BJ138DRAFT_1168048 [Hygrophoropsis aurantiaca]|uniref:Uncharacterized protein n=1 Tax=Hygrophoropsis aurantiaca TaxID=72124 RepID=A0ACB7ZR08_9AGAM|nr:hypothetical protein BJ138DRAFT_1168048 [Hygrophoropsis aurantiaca]
MANQKRSPKFARQWRQSDLDDYNIKTQFQTASTFFNTPVLPPPTADEELFTTEFDTDTLAKDNRIILTYLGYAMDPDESESAVTELSWKLFYALGYGHPPHLIIMFKELQILSCGERKNANTGISIIDRSSGKTEFVLVQECRRIGATRDPYPQSIATVIAAFQSNNSRRIAAGLDPLENKTIPAIITIGSSPTFLKVPVTAELADCVGRGVYPITPTVVSVHEPEIPRPSQRIVEGMRPLDNRHIVFQCYEAFRQFVD